MRKEKNIMNAINSLENAANFRGYDAAVPYDRNYAGVYTPPALGVAQYGVTPNGLTTFDLTIIHAPSGAPAAINISLFEALYNGGTFVNGNLVFTTAGGTVTISGTTQKFQALMERSKTQPFRIAFIRMKSLQTAQQANPFTLANTSVWGASQTNNISPATYKDAYQQDPLTVDVPVDFTVDSDRGIRLLVNTSEDLNITLFIDLFRNPTEILRGNEPLRGNTSTVAPILRNVDGKNMALISPANPAGTQRSAGFDSDMHFDSNFNFNRGR